MTKFIEVTQKGEKVIINTDNIEGIRQIKTARIYFINQPCMDVDESYEDMLTILAPRTLEKAKKSKEFMDSLIFESKGE